MGTNWIKYDEAAVHLGDRWLFQNIVTGAVRNDPTNAHTLPDLDSPLLTESVCAPLRVPSAPSQNTLELEGRFAVLSTTSGVFLEHCATHLHELLTDAAPWATAAPWAIMWVPRPTRPLDGIFLPSRRRFTVSRPPGADMADVLSAPATSTSSACATPLPTSGPRPCRRLERIDVTSRGQLLSVSIVSMAMPAGCGAGHGAGTWRGGSDPELTRA